MVNSNFELPDKTTDPQYHALDSENLAPRGLKFDYRFKSSYRVPNNHPLIDLIEKETAPEDNLEYEDLIKLY